MQAEMWHGRLLLAAVVAALSTLAVVAAAAAGQGAAGAQLPDLVQEAPANLGVTTAKTVRGPRFRLGFRSAVHNAGTGPLLLDASRPGTATPDMAVSQVVRHDGGRFTTREGVGVMRYTRAAGHVHWHLLGFEVYELRSADGRLARPSRKTGFCIGDRYDADFFADWPHEPPARVWKQQCGLRRPDLLRLRSGMSVGFGDDYEPQLEGQYVDVTGLPAGRYDLVHRVNVDRALLESDYANNAACVGVQLSWPRGARRGPSFHEVPCSPGSHHTEVRS